MGAMKLEGVHHITAISADAQKNLDFYVGVLGLRMVKKTVNQDEPSVYHLFFADEKGSAGADLTFFEFPGAPPGRAGDGMVHTIRHRVASADALDFWQTRLSENGVRAEVAGDELRFEDPEGLGQVLAVVETDDEPLVANHPDVPAEFALQGFDGAAAYSSNPEASTPLLETLGFEKRPRTRSGGGGVVSSGGWEARGEQRGGVWAYDPPPEDRGLQGAGTVHHIAWASTMEEHEAWRDKAVEGGAPVIDRFYFKSIYFREPSGVLFEIATLGPGFTADEPLETLGERLSLPPDYERLRDQIEATVKPLVNPRAE